MERLGTEDIVARLRVLIASILLVGLMQSTDLAAGPKTYRVTGQVLEVTKNLIVVQKGSKRMEFVRDSSTGVSGDLKVGSVVTIRYRKIALSVEAGPAKPAEKVKP